MHVKDHLSLTELKQLARVEQDAKVSKRIQMILLAIEGYTAPAMARSLGFSRRVCQRWVQRYNAHGLKGLQDQPGRARSIEQASGLVPCLSRNWNFPSRALA